MLLSHRILNTAVCLLIIFQMQSNAQPSRRDLSSLMSLLGQKYSGNKALLVILDSGSKVHDDAQLYRAGSSDTSDDETNIERLLLQHHKVNNLLPIKKSTTKSLLQLKNDHLQRLRDNRDQNKNALRSPIIKKLLRISNRIQCNAKDSCQDKCSDKYRGSKVVKCNLQCEIKYDCEEERDDCDGDGCDSCAGSDECQMSTRGERLVTKDTKCKRC